MPIATQVTVSKTGIFNAVSQIKPIGVKSLNLLRPLLYMKWGSRMETVILCPVKILSIFSEPWINRPLGWCFVATIHLKMSCRVRASH